MAAREVLRSTGLTRDHLNDGRLVSDGAIQWLHQRRNIRRRCLRQHGRNALNILKRHQRFIALQIHDHGVIGPRQLINHFGQAIGTRSMIPPGHGNLSTASGHFIGDPRIIRRDHYVSCPGLHGSLPHPGHHGLVCNGQ